ncbi:hypothetical protein VNO77_23317 [Canavalia gladiata]|uniref:Uncharacterized protein n=1 Tax=Canavalia gladiata TaxID=3824 RepID=A0AAN9L6Q3_CANGL
MVLAGQSRFAFDTDLDDQKLDTIGLRAFQDTLYSDLCSSYEPHEDVSSAVSIFQGLNIENLHKSFDTHNGGSNSTTSAILISNHLSKSGLEEKSKVVNDSSAWCLDASSVYHDDEQFGSKIQNQILLKELLSILLLSCGVGFTGIMAQFKLLSLSILFINLGQKDSTILLVPVLILLLLPLHQFGYPSFIASTCCVPHQLLQRKLMFLVSALATFDRGASREMKGLTSVTNDHKSLNSPAVSKSDCGFQMQSALGHHDSDTSVNSPGSVAPPLESFPDLIRGIPSFRYKFNPSSFGLDIEGSNLDSTCFCPICFISYGSLYEFTYHNWARWPRS